MSPKFDPSIPLLTEVFGEDGAAVAQADNDNPQESTQYSEQYSNQHGNQHSNHGDAWPSMPASAMPALATSYAAPAAVQAPLLAPPQGAAPPLGPLGPLDLIQLERRVAERVIGQLQGRVDAMLEQALRDSLAEVVHGAMGQLTGEIRDGLQRTLENVVARAVAEAINSR